MKIFLDNLWRWKCGLPELEVKPKKLLSYEELYKAQWDIEFEKMMHNRLIMGAIRYGGLNVDNKYDIIKTMFGKLSKYKDTGNKEFLVDIANYALIEFHNPQHPNAHLESKDDTDHAFFHSKELEHQQMTGFQKEI